MQIDWMFAAFALLLFANTGHTDEPLFSGPQVGETLVPFQARGPFPENGKADSTEKFDVLADVNDSPIVLVFVHQVTRPSIATVRLIMNYAATKKDQGLNTRIVFLSDDPTETEAFLRRASGALPQEVMPLISLDGIEGPGAYGLNRKMTLTILVGTQGKVTANFALVQPSIQADGPKIGHAIVKATGGEEMPTLAEMGFEDRSMARRPAARPGDEQPEPESIYRRLMSSVIQKDATAEQVADAAKSVEAFAAKHDWFKERVYHASRTIVSSGKLSNYGTSDAQAVIQRWAKEFAPDNESQ